MYAELVFPLPFRNTFTYSVPKSLEPLAKPGVRAVAPFGKRVLTGFIVATSSSTVVQEKIKPVDDILDSKPIFTEKSFEFYKWLADYYLSSLGEALKLAVPYGLDVESKRKILSDTDFALKLLDKENDKNSLKSKILKVLSERGEINFSHLQRLVQRKNIYSVLSNLEKQGAVTILNELAGAKVKIKKSKFVKLAKPIGEIYSHFPEIERKSPKQISILLFLSKHKGESVPLGFLLEKTESPKSSVDGLVKRGLTKVFEKEVSRDYVEAYTEKKVEFHLTEKQQKIIDEITVSIEEEKFKAFLLHGVTGSGKTQVYIELTKKVLQQNKSALILVPEISLTPQITSRFYNNFGNEVSVLHSRMSLGERYDSWRKILNGKSRVVIGARSALFAPLNNIGVIVVDEEHDASYKQFDSVPKYNARDSAVILAQHHKCSVVLGSATPSIESMYNAKTGKYDLLELQERIDNAKLPRIHLISISSLPAGQAGERKKKKMEHIFSKFLLDEIEVRLKKKEGIIILQNRRGFSTQIYCEDCGELEICDNCSVPLVYHINQNILKCHYCGFTKEVPKVCRNCGSYSLKYFGTGTERIEDEIEFYFPQAKVKRVDSDSISKKSSLSKILMEFGKGEVDILVGTQMVSKGLDFPRLTLVGVISAETTLWLPDFRADERTFQLLTQVSGRAGRSKVEGEVVIQTFNEKSFTLQKVLLNDYAGFYEREITSRQRMDYPPFTRICLIETKDTDNDKAKGAAVDFHKELIAYKKYLQITPVSAALIARLKGQYRYHILVKSSKEKDPGGGILRKAVLDSFIEFNRKSHFRDVKLIFDVDPQSVM
ncbi:MAG: primosomal protein N' [Ignavibacteria bacterium GWA2_35_9]|nr:MAG: primosomal protein N' [Ignavibacteria bacterium GWA2_35_9]OGU50592.1 MAG: primosomal protein N' [Ignavibacteria bacterium GWC2_36_12]